MINKGASGLEAALPFSLISNLDGLPKPGHSWVDAGGGLTAELQIRLPGSGAYANATIARIFELSNGDYEYRMDATETATAGKVYYYPNVTDHDTRARWEDIVAVVATSVPSAVTTSLSTIESNTELIKGLLHLNARLDNTVYAPTTGLMTSARLRVFASAAACNAATNGALDNADGEIYRFTITGVDEGDGKLLSYQLVRTL